MVTNFVMPHGKIREFDNQSHVGTLFLHHKMLLNEGTNISPRRVNKCTFLSNGELYAHCI